MMYEIKVAHLTCNVTHDTTRVIGRPWPYRRDRVSAGTLCLPGRNLNSMSNSAKAKLHLISLLDLGADAVKNVKGL